MSLNVVDSSACLEYFGDTVRAKLFAAANEHVGNLIVPAIVLHEVCKKVRRERGCGSRSSRKKVSTPVDS